MRLAGKTALVTGSSQGIGEAVALRLADEGADVVVHYRSHPEGAQGVVERIAKLGRRTVAIQADLSRVTEVQRLIADGVTQLGPLDILVNNAGVEKRADFRDVSEADYDFVMDVNLKGLFFTTQAFVRSPRRKRPGRVINMSLGARGAAVSALHPVLHEQRWGEDDDPQPGDRACAVRDHDQLHRSGRELRRRSTESS